MKIYFLGTSGWFSSPTGDTPCILIDSKEGYIIFDAGNGFYKIGDYIKENKQISLFISHFHIDHVSGLHTLNKFKFTQGLDVYVGQGRSEDFITLVNPPFTKGYQPRSDNVGDLNFEVRLHELSEKTSNIPFSASAIEQFHGYRDHGYRIQLEGKTLAYSGDCGITDASYKLADQVDLLIHECSDFEENPNGKKWGHVFPEEVAELAKKSQVKQLILTHFAPTQYLTLEHRRLAEKRAQAIFPETAAAFDGFTLDL